MSGEDISSPPASLEALQSWADEAGMETIPVLNAYEFETWSLFELDFGTPSIVHIGPDMRILSFDEGIQDPSSFLESQ